MEVKFSFHAYQRVQERLSISHAQLAEMITADLVVCVGVEPKSNREHKLFYSEKDKMCFVAIVDVDDCTVITVLPVDYHNNIAWNISFDAQQDAKRIMLGGRIRHPVQELPERSNAEVCSGLIAPDTKMRDN